MLNCAVDHILQEFYTLFLTSFRTYKIASPPHTKMTILIVSTDIVIISIYFGVFCLLQVFQFLIRISKVRNKHHLHSKHLDSYLVYGSEGVVRV
jgi:hypothetical protein